MGLKPPQSTMSRRSSTVVSGFHQAAQYAPSNPFRRTLILIFPNDIFFSEYGRGSTRHRTCLFNLANKVVAFDIASWPTISLTRLSHFPLFSFFLTPGGARFPFSLRCKADLANSGADWLVLGAQRGLLRAEDLLGSKARCMCS